jgi:hypothetical protein
LGIVRMNQTTRVRAKSSNDEYRDDDLYVAIATNFSLGPDVSFRGEAEVGRAAEPAATVEKDPTRTSVTSRALHF